MCPELCNAEGIKSKEEVQVKDENAGPKMMS
jgi:hypothetical protein